VAVWGPAGAPGRTTLAIGLAAEVGRHRRTVLVDADPWGGTVAQQLGIVDEVSGMLAATRLVAAGQLPERFGSVQRSLDHRLSVVTGLPRADRWVEVRAGVVDHLLDVARGHGCTVVDTGASLERDAAVDAGRTGRNTMTLEALEAADEVVVVGSADPVGLSRLARGLVELREALGPRVVRVVVNRMRPTLGWAEQDIATMLGTLVPPGRLHFLPEDRPAVDRALVAGRSLAEVGDSAVGRAVAGVAAALVPEAAPRQAAKSR
jgi:MinD-like ATPase involved in chromosome partitioning or flagellar assembly